MSGLTSALRRPPGRWVGPDPSIALGAGLIAGVAGLAAAAGLWLFAIAAVFILLFFAIGLLNWRISMVALLAYIPVSGILPLALYPTTGPGVLAKDFMFVIPAYAGFFGTYIAQHRRISFDAAPIGILAVLAFLVIVGSFNPALDGLLVPLIGIKVWLMYIPMLFIGYHMIRELDDVRYLFALMAVTAIVPAVVGIIEAALVYNGQTATVAGWYGDAAGAAFTDYGTVDVGGDQRIARIPSTFTFVAQYYVFVSCMAAVAYAWWRMTRPGETGWYRLAIAGLLLIAAFTSGSRGAFIFVPLLFGLIFLIEGQLSLKTVGAGLVGLIGLLAATGLFGVGIVPLATALWENLVFNWQLVIVDGFNNVSGHLFGGQGTGSDTQAARHVTERLSTSQGGTWEESWWIKTFFEFGIAGFVVCAILMATLLTRLFNGHRLVRDPGMRAMSAAVIAIVIWSILYGTKGSYMDIDPLNVYFWLFIGMAFKVHQLTRDRDRAPDGPAADAT